MCCDFLTPHMPFPSRRQHATLLHVHLGLGPGSGRVDREVVSGVSAGAGMGECVDRWRTKRSYTLATPILHFILPRAACSRSRVPSLSGFSPAGQGDESVNSDEPCPVVGVDRLPEAVLQLGWCGRIAGMLGVWPSP